jgi:hypothetical protein
MTNGFVRTAMPRRTLIMRLMYGNKSPDFAFSFHPELLSRSVPVQGTASIDHA